MFSKNLPQNMFKTRLDILGTVLGNFRVLKNSWFFENISKTRPSMEHWAKEFFRKKYPKTCSEHFWTIWERFWAFLNFWKFIDLLKTLRRLDPPWNTRQKDFYEKIAPKHVQNNFGQFGYDFVRFWNSEFFKFS